MTAEWYAALRNDPERWKKHLARKRMLNQKPDYLAYKKAYNKTYGAAYRKLCREMDLKWKQKQKSVN